MALNKTSKSILSFILAIVVAFIVIRILFWILGFAIKLLGYLLLSAIVLIVALPLYVIIKKKLFR